jgi:hypothetical protein
MPPIGDPRWKPLFTLGTLIAQIVLCAVVLGLTSTEYLSLLLLLLLLSQKPTNTSPA